MVSIVMAFHRLFSRRSCKNRFHGIHTSENIRPKFHPIPCNPYTAPPAQRQRIGHLQIRPPIRKAVFLSNHLYVQLQWMRIHTLEFNQSSRPSSHRSWGRNPYDYLHDYGICHRTRQDCSFCVAFLQEIALPM